MLLKPSQTIFRNGIRTVIAGSAFGLAFYYPQSKLSGHVIAATWTDALYKKWQNVVKATQDYLVELADDPPASIITEKAIEQGYIIDINEYGEDAKENWKDENMNYAIIGASGAGKSTFANTFAGKTGIEKDACKDGVGEMTGLKAKIKWQYVLPEIMGKDRSKGQIVFWDLPGWGTQKYEPKEYIKKLGLPIYRGILLTTSTRFTSNDVAFYKSLHDVISALIPDGATKKHVPVYIVRTKFDRDLRRELVKKTKLKYDADSNKEERKQNKDEQSLSHDLEQLFEWMWPQKLLTKKEFMECWTKTVDDIKDDMAKEFKGVFNENDKENKEQLFEKLYILSSDWDNRMLTLDNKNDEQYTGFPGLVRRIMLDPIYFAKDWKVQKREKHTKIVESKCDELVRQSPKVFDSALYETYTARQHEVRHSMLQILGISIAGYVAFLCGKRIGYEGGYETAILHERQSENCYDPNHNRVI